MHQRTRISQTTYRQLRRGRNLIRQVTPARVARVKYDAELAYWRGELRNLSSWFEEGRADWWGVPPPTIDQRVTRSDVWASNAVQTLHQMRPTYLEELQLSADAFEGQRVLEVGCGPLVPALQFTGCERHAVDPLVDQYVEAGWPLYDYDATVIKAFGERLPYPDDYFDAVIAVNSLDHVDDFPRVASEMQRVLRPEGRVCFEVEYHAATVTEPLELDDGKIRAAFASCELEKVLERDGGELYDALARRFSLVTTKFRDIHSGSELFTTWHGKHR
jgi:SAM-dependent methyltransferase